MSRMKFPELEQAVYDEWSNMHHNASLSVHFPDFKNEYEEHLFWECLSDATSFWIEDLQEMVKEDFGETLHFYSYGRQGATIAPDEYMASAPCNRFGRLNSSRLPFRSSLEDYNEWARILKLFRFINKYWEDTAKYIPKWWKETKEANGWQADIDAHEGMTLRTVEVWR